MAIWHNHQFERVLRVIRTRQPDRWTLLCDRDGWCWLRFLPWSGNGPWLWRGATHVASHVHPWYNYLDIQAHWRFLRGESIEPPVHALFRCEFLRHLRCRNGLVQLNLHSFHANHRAYRSCSRGLSAEIRRGPRLNVLSCLLPDGLLLCCAAIGRYRCECLGEFSVRRRDPIAVDE